MSVHKVSFMLLVLAFLSGCSGMQWYRGAMIQYKNIENPEKGEYLIHVMGSMPHSPEDLESAVIAKAEELCRGDVELVDVQFGTYNSTNTGGGLVLSSSNPEVVGKAKCKDA